jgi:hypothetical protein
MAFCRAKLLPDKTPHGTAIPVPSKSGNLSSSGASRTAQALVRIAAAVIARIMTNIAVFSVYRLYGTEQGAALPPSLLMAVSPI